MNEILAELFYREFTKIHAEESSPSHKVVLLDMVLSKLFADLTRKEKMHLANTFARIAYVSDQQGLSKALQWRIHLLRRRAKQAQRGLVLTENQYLNSLKTACFCLRSFSKLPIPADLEAVLPEEDTEEEAIQVRFQAKEKYSSLRVWVQDINPGQEYLVCRPVEEDGFSEDELLVRYNVPGMNEHFNKSVRAFQVAFKGKGFMNLLDVVVDDKGFLIPKAFVLEPDYLVDVTAVAHCFSGKQLTPYYYFINKFSYSKPSVAMAVGNLANNALDELIAKPELPFDDFYKGLFNKNPLSFIHFNDDEIREIGIKGKQHYRNLKTVIARDLSDRKIEPKEVSLEPSFYSNRYGLQGRLDLWHRREGENKASIIELKSGKAFMPNQFGLNEQHYVQVVMYDMLVSSVYKELANNNLSKYILYSGEEEKPLRFAPSSRAHQDEVIQQRNLLIALERHMMALDELPDDAYGFLANINIPEVKGFVVQQLADFNRTFHDASDLEKRYFMAFVAFIAREQYIAKVGIEGNERINGLASLWLSSQADKEQSFEILRGLHLFKEEASTEKPRLYFQRTEKTNELANFRKGDNVVLYPSFGEEDNVLNHQIFKGFIIEINAQTIEVALHYRQSNSKPFSRNLSWNAEKDTLDKSFTNLHQAVFRFLKMPKEKRDLFLGLAAPAEPLEPRPSFVFGNPDLSHDQQDLLTKILRARDYFLLVGPPGTGKTKFMLAELVRHLLFNTNETVLLLAYTNRAVDEICDALHEFAEGQYLRIANEHSTDERYLGHLLDELAQKAANRKEILSLLQGRRILVATISKLISNPILLELVKVDTAIVDEASQVLEPYLAGILPLMGRFILIGDHKQLPAVVQQSTEQSALHSELLAEIGLKNRRNSLFERLYNLALANGWTWAYDHLQHQGRMHEDICVFPSQAYYESKLLLLPEPQGNWQRQPLDYRLPPSPSALEQFLAKNRIAYFHLPTDAGGNSKTNRYEAEQICALVQAFHRLYEATGEPFTKDTIGIITPFRAQIGMIRHVLGEANPFYTEFTIDTVERYQGGARDIILFSVCANTFGQMDQIVAASDDETVDRKLNVAITRARRHFVLVGNEQLMLSNPYYGALIRFLADRRGN